MGQHAFIHTLMPNSASLGYALFLAINAAGVWGGVFPFLPMAFQTHQILFWFFLAQSTVFSATYAASAIGAYYFPLFTRHFLVKLTSGLYFLGWCFLIAAIYFTEYSLILVFVGGGLLGLGSAGFYMLWQRLFASQDSDVGSQNLLVGTAWGALFYFALYLIPQAVTAYLIPLVFLPLFGLAVMVNSRTIDTTQAMFEDVPRNHPQVYKQVIKDYWRSALCLAAVGFCAGIMRSIAVADPTIGVYVNALSAAGMLIAALFVLWLWRFKGLRLTITSAYRVVFPFLITSFLAVPLLPVAYTQWLAAILYAVYAAAIILMMMQCAQVSRDRGINPIFIYGFVGTALYALHSIGFIGGSFVEMVHIMGLAPLSAVAIVAIWALGLMHFVGSGGFISALGGRGSEDAIELISFKPDRLRSAANDQTEVSDVSDAPDRISVQAALIQEYYRLSAREAEVMELLARGHSVARIAGMLVVSENTVRTHSKRIYAKLDIHKKQELVDLIETF